MKTKSFGSYQYIVKKYYETDEGLAVKIDCWTTAEKAFLDAKTHEAKHGNDMAFVFKARQCKPSK